MSTGTAKKGGDFIKLVNNLLRNSEGFNRIFEKVKVVDGGDGRCVAEFQVSGEHLNRGGTLHGGFTAALVDTITTYALLSKPSHPGVSVNLDVSYMKLAKEGDDIIVDGKCVRAGRKLAFTTCELRHKRDGSLIATASHIKFVDFGDKK